jgi:hypothetical protein
MDVVIEPLDLLETKENLKKLLQYAGPADKVLAKAILEIISKLEEMKANLMTLEP